MSSIAKKIINQSSYTLELIKGKNKEGKDFFAYIVFPADVFEELKPRLGKEELDLSQFGIVVYGQEGKEVPEGLHEQVLAHFEAEYLK